jgi:hypothetical protein
VKAAIVILLAGCASEPLETGPECGTATDIATLPYENEKVDGCGVWLGAIHLADPSDADALQPLRNLTRVDGRLSIFRNHGIEDLGFLSRLEVIGGELSITHDQPDGNLTSLDGLDSLREIGGLRLAVNFDLADLRGLARLEIVDGDVEIDANEALPHAEIDWLLGRIQVSGTTNVSR